MDDYENSRVAVEPPRNAHMAADVTGMQHNTSTDEKNDNVEHTEVRTGLGRQVTQVEHTKINEAIAQGIAANVDDFMVSGISLPTYIRIHAANASLRPSSTKPTKQMPMRRR